MGDNSDMKKYRSGILMGYQYFKSVMDGQKEGQAKSNTPPIF